MNRRRGPRGPERPRGREYPRYRYPYPYQPYQPVPYYYPPGYAPGYAPGYQQPQQPGYCPYGGTAYTVQEDMDVSTLANQLGVSEDTILSFNPGLSPDSTISSGQVVCLPTS